MAFVCPCLAPIIVAPLASSIPRGASHVHSAHSRRIKHGRADPAGCVLKGIAPHVLSIPHLGIRALLLTRALPSSCSFSQACPGGHIVSTAPEQSAGSQNNHPGKSVSRSWGQIAISVGVTLGIFWRADQRQQSSLGKSRTSLTREHRFVGP